MKFFEKLDLLMNITNTSNSLLARIIALDPSFVSRLRRGKRIPAKNENYIKAMAEYFAKNCSAQYQKTALFDTIRSTSRLVPEFSENITDLIYNWLCDDEEDSSKPIENFLEGFKNFKFKKASQTPDIDLENISAATVSNQEIFYGIEGKQAAVIKFLSLVLQNKKPQTLLLHSDENMEWLTGNPEFTAKWASLLSQAVINGNKIKIIHTVSRNLDEMFYAIKQWVPIYITGTIEPYYYPKTRDGVFRRTLFIAPETAAVISSSIGNETKNTANFLITDKNTIKALICEFNDFLAICRPLIKIFTSFNQDKYLALLSEFEDEEANSIVKTDALSSITIPFDLAVSINSRIKIDNKDKLLEFHRIRIKKLENNLQKFNFTEIITIPDLKSIQEEKVIINFSDMLSHAPLYYTVEEISRHLQNVIRLLKNFENYNVYLVNKSHLPGCMIYAKEDVGVLIGKSSTPPAVFAINESNMTAAFWDYMNLLVSKKSSKDKNLKKQTIAQLEAMVEKLNLLPDH